MVTDKLKEMVEELRHDLGEVKEQVKQLLPGTKEHNDLPVRRECFNGSFSRSVPIPSNADPDGIKAKMKRGVLRITMPKLKGRTSRGRSIPIN